MLDYRVKSGDFLTALKLGQRGLAMKSRLGWFFILLSILCVPATVLAQDTASITGTVTDATGAALANAQVTVSSSERGINRATTTNSSGDYLVAGLPSGVFNVTVAAPGFKKYEAKGVILRVAQKARNDVTLQIGAATTEVTVEGINVAQVETQSSDLSGVVTGTQISQLQLNGRNFTQLVTLIPGVSNQTQQDEGTVGVYGNVGYSMNGGRTEYNNWEIDGGDNMDNGSNTTLNVYPNLDAIAEFKVLTSNYGAQYGRNGSGTVEVVTKSGTKSFHGTASYFGRNDFFNALNFFDPAGPAPEYKKHDWGYTVGGPVTFPGYNKGRDKTFFFWSQEWRREIVPGQTFQVPVPSLAERGGDFSDLCPGADCPTDPRTGLPFDGSLGPLPVDVNAQALLVEIPEPTAAGSVCGSGFVGCFNASPANATTWREELVRVDHNFNSKLQATFRYIHDSWKTVTPTTLWSCGDLDNGCSFPTIQTNFVGPGTSTVFRLTANATPTLLNEFVFSYTGDHIFLNNIGPGAAPRPSSMTMTGLFPFLGTNLPGIFVTGNSAYSFEEDPSYIPWDNANPTYTVRDNVTKIIGKHNLQFGAYLVIAQKNETSSFGDTGGMLTFDSSNANSTGNAFADFLIGRIDHFQQVNAQPKYYFRYKILEPYFQDDWHVTSHLTLNLGLRVSLFGTYREKYNQTFNLEPGLFNPANAPAFAADGSLIDPVTLQPLAINDPRVFNGIAQCGGTGQPAGCVEGHLFNPAPRVGFAWDPKGDGKMSVRGGYGIFFEHGNGNEQNVEALEATAPLVLNPTQPNIAGYTSIGSGGGTILAFPLGFNAIATRGVWPYVQQWNLDVQRELPQHIVASLAYVGSKGTHLGLRRDLNQLHSLSPSLNPYQPGEAIGPDDCTNGTTPSGVPITGQAAINFGVACGNDPNPNRPFVGFSSINFMQYAGDSIYNSMQVSLRRSLAPLTLSVAYTYSHAIDDASSGGAFNAPSFVDSYNLLSGRASSDFDQRHILNIGYVYDLPLFRGAGMTERLLGGWQFSGITQIQTGVPFSVTYSGFSDNAGVSNGSGPGTYADLVGDPNASPGPSPGGHGPLLYNPSAFAPPRGLTFGNSGRNSLRNPRTTNFDMALFKHFKINESTGFEFRAEAFNVFNHTQWNGVNSDVASPGDFMRPGGAHRARIMQFGAKFIF
jgi:hypothetical protein